MKALIAFLVTCVAVLGLCSLVLLGVWLHDSHSLHATNLKLEQELEASRAALDAATQQNESMTAQLKNLHTSTEQLQDRLGRLESSTNNAENAYPQPYRVRAFVGKKSLGDAWIIPQNVTRDPETGHYRFEPVLWLAEENKKQFTVYHTNVVEREVASSEVNNYYPSSYYPYYVGRPWWPGHGKPPSGGHKPPVDARPRGNPLPSTQANAGGQPSARARLFSPPLSTVSSRPQVLGRPATSEVNARLFAP